MSRSQGAATARNAVDASHASAAAKTQEARRTINAGDVATPASPSNLALGGGVPLDPAVRADMEARFGQSFVDVRIHDDERAHRSAADLEAKAYTHGSHVAFAEGRYAPLAPDGKRLLAHELAHVVQQRRGGSTPALSAAATHEAGAAQVAAQVASGAASVTVPGATGVGVAREIDDEKKQSHGLPFGDAARVLTPGADYWLTHEPNTAGMAPLEVRDEINQINEKLFRQTQSSPATARLEQVRDSLELARSRLPQATAPGAKPRTGRGGKPGPAAAAATAAMAERPPLTKRSASTTEPEQLATDYNDIVRDLGRKDLTPQEKADLQLELDTIEPLVDRDLVRRSALRYGDVIDEALTPEDRYYGADTPMIERMRRIDSIKPDSEQPGMSYLRHGRELIPVADQTLQAIRANAMGQLNQLEGSISQANDEVASDYGDLMYRSFDKHPVVGFISSVRSGENPADWQEKLMSFVATSNMQLREFDRMRTAAKDPWNAAAPSLEAMARKVDAGLRVGEGARNYLDYKTDLLYEGTRGAIRHLGRMKTAGQVASSIAFSPLGGALYSATESTLEQLSEMHYGQRERFDYLAPVIDAAAAYVGGKVTNRMLGVAGKNAPLWLRTAAFVSGDRLGAAATTITHETIDRALKRNDKNFSDIMGDAASDLTDWKQAGWSLFTLGFGHAVKSHQSSPSGKSAKRGYRGAGGVLGKARAGIAAAKLGMADAAPATTLPTGSAPTAMTTDKRAASQKHKAAVPMAATPTPATTPPAASKPGVAKPATATTAPLALDKPAANANFAEPTGPSFGDASFDALVAQAHDSQFGRNIEAAERAGPAPFREDTTRSRAQVDAIAHSDARRNSPPGQVPGAQIQHDTKVLDVTTKLPAGTNPLHPDVINENKRWLQSSSGLPATELHVDPRGGGTRYYVDDVPRGRTGDAGTPGVPRPRGLSKKKAKAYTTEHKFTDAYLIKEAAKNIVEARQRANLPPLDPRMLAIAAGEMARWRTSGHSGVERSGRNVDVALAATQRPAPVSPSAVSSLQQSSALLNWYLTRLKAND